MTRGYSIAAVGAVLVIAALAWAILRTSERTRTSLDEAADIRGQPGDERAWTSVVEATPVVTSSVLGRPITMHVDGDEIFVIDASVPAVERFDLQGNHLARIGNGPGAGPGEHAFVIDFAVDGNDVWLLDHRSRKVSRFRRDGEFVASFVTDRPYVRIATHDTTLVLLDLVAEDIFRVVSQAGAALDGFGKVVSARSDNPLSFSGTIASWPGGGIAYLPTYASFLFVFGSDEDPTIVELLDKRPFPSMNDTRPPSGQVLASAPSQAYHLADLAIDHERISVLVIHRDEVERRAQRAFVDQYSTTDFSYVRSIEVPTPTGSIAIHGATIYALQDTSIVALRVDN